jgi:hypothetical protein
MQDLVLGTNDIEEAKYGPVVRRRPWIHIPSLIVPPFSYSDNTEIIPSSSHKHEPQGMGSIVQNEWGMQDDKRNTGAGLLDTSAPTRWDRGLACISLYACTYTGYSHRCSMRWEG